MTDESNGQVAGRIIRDLDALIDRLAPEVVWDNSVHAPPDHGGVFRGKEAVAQIFREWVAAWSGYRIDVEDIVESGDDVLLVVNETGVGRSSGIAIEHRHCYRWSFREGMIVAGTSYATLGDALEAISAT